MKKIILNSKEFLRELHLLQIAIIKKPVLPVLENILVRVVDGHVTMIATDLQITICRTITCESAKGNYEFLLPFEFTMKVVKLSEGAPIQIEAKGVKKVILEDGESSYELSVAGKVGDFPKVPEVAGASVDMPMTLVEQLLKAVATIGTEESRPWSHHVLVESRVNKKEITIASTDAANACYCYSLPDLSLAADCDLLLPAKAIKAIEKMESLSIGFDDKFIKLCASGIEVYITRFDGKFINWRAVVPDSWPGNLEVSRGQLKHALERCCLSTDQFKDTLFRLKEKDGIVTLFTNDETAGRQISVTIEGSYTGELEAVTVSAEFLLRLVNQVDYERISLAIHQAMKPALLRSPEDQNYLGLIFTKKAAING